MRRVNRQGRDCVRCCAFKRYLAGCQSVGMMSTGSTGVRALGSEEKMTYYKILRYLVKNGLSEGKAHYVCNMIRELVNNPPDTRFNHCVSPHITFKVWSPLNQIFSRTTRAAMTQPKLRFIVVPLVFVMAVAGGIASMPVGFLIT